jgi:hypothetical protein
MMVSAATNGCLSFWDLDRKALAFVSCAFFPFFLYFVLYSSTDLFSYQVKPQCHDGAIVSAQFFASQPLLLTAGMDNALKLWIFDQVCSIMLGFWVLGFGYQPTFVGGRPAAPAAVPVWSHGTARANSFLRCRWQRHSQRGARPIAAVRWQYLKNYVQLTLLMPGTFRLGLMSSRPNCRKVRWRKKPPSLQ